MALLHYMWLYHSSTSLYFTLHYSTTALLSSTSLYCILSWLYSHLHAMALPHSTWLFCYLPWLHFTPLDSTLLHVHGSTSLYLTLHYYTIYYSSTLTLHYSIPWLYFTLFLFIAFYQGSISPYLTLHSFTMTLLHSTWHYISLPNWLYFTLLHSTAFYHGSTGLYLTILFSTLLYHGSTSLYLLYTLFYHSSTSLYFLLPWLYFTLYLTLLLSTTLHSTMVVLHCTWFSTFLYHYGSTSLYYQESTQ